MGITRDALAHHYRSADQVTSTARCESMAVVRFVSQANSLTDERRYPRNTLEHAMTGTHQILAEVWELFDPARGWVVHSITAKDRYRYEHKRVLKTQGEARHLANRVADADQINLEHWHFFEYAMGSREWEADPAHN